MVMPNRHDGASSPEWWDDLPPGVKKRISYPGSGREPELDFDAPRSYRLPVLANLSGLAVFALIAALILACVFLFLASSLLADRGPFGT